MEVMFRGNVASTILPEYEINLMTECQISLIIILNPYQTSVRITKGLPSSIQIS